ncbi:putative arsenic methyltransferase Cyt19 [Aspergillus ibericus CBS 121593]|uniref:Arsenite methyltransferase n=1 Tax=Aspergillus ibericus CBS 121593 TaxID=1448316 RepID=A0A395H6P9_9EURO|nr:putative UbiE/COQ5 family methyltransferase [Aspergillus ibericus CBS 121593]RAL02845.1 putative UbiE/COQ5 family methyltransferase [Aspergillus ibericus CBS 121593]
MEPSKMYNLVQSRYSELASRSFTEHTAVAENVAKAFGYRPSELRSIPPNANMGLSCGNPVAVANLQAGEVVIDLGSGGGMDVLLAAQKVGPTGKAIGVDMTRNMIELARENAKKANAYNAVFLESAITSIPLPDATADCVISNCVVNLVPTAEKPRAFREMFRLLKPGGRLAMTDILVWKPLPDGMAMDLSLYVGCIAGASRVQEYEEYLRNAGFEQVMIVDCQKDLNIYKEVFVDQDEASCGCCQSGAGGSLKSGQSIAERAEVNLNEWAGSFEIYALKS